MTSHIILPDVQAKPGQDFEFLRWAGQYCADHTPDVIVCIGDFADMQSLSSYDVGKKEFEGRRYTDDITSAIEAMDKFISPIQEEISRREVNHKKRWRPRLVLTTGNHECYDDQTEVLTKEGWKLFKDVHSEDEVYTMASDLKGEWQKPTDYVAKYFKGVLYTHSSRTVDLAITPGHRTLWTNNSSNKVFEGLASMSPKNCDVFVSAKSGNGLDMTDEQIAFNAVALTDSHHGKYGALTFYQSGEQAEVIREIITGAGVEFKERAIDRDIKEICGKTLKTRAKTSYEFYMKRPSWCVDNNKRIPSIFFDLNENQFNLFLKTLVFCDGTIPTDSVNSMVFYGKKEICEDLQALCVTKGYRATITEYRDNQFRVNITKTNVCRVENFLDTTTYYEGLVYCLTVPNSSLMVRRNGKPVIQGNCRINTAISKDRKLEGLISIDDLLYKEFGWEVYPFLEVVTIDGVCYSHYFTSGVMGRPVSSPRALVTKKHMSCVMGHVQECGIDMSQFRGDGTPLIGIFAGIYTPYDETYLNKQTNIQHRQIWHLREVKEGFHYPTAVSLNYLERKYGN